MVIVLSPGAEKRLLEKGYVVIFMDRMRGSGQDWATDRRGGKIADVYVTEPVKVKPTEEELKPYVEYSGFGSTVEWLIEIRRIYGRIPEGFLYLAVKKPATSEVLLEALEVPELGLNLRQVLAGRLRAEYSELERLLLQVSRRRW